MEDCEHEWERVNPYTLQCKKCKGVMWSRESSLRKMRERPYLSENEIREEIWKIIEQEIEEVSPFIPFMSPAKNATEKIKERVNELLNENEAILVYQP